MRARKTRPQGNTQTLSSWGNVAWERPVRRWRAGLFLRLARRFRPARELPLARNPKRSGPDPSNPYPGKGPERALPAPDSPLSHDR